jgi:hypothetical protein
MSSVVILAQRRKDAVALANLLGLRSRDYSFPYQASTIDGLALRRVIIHPSFAERRDKHAIMAVVRRGTRKSPKSKIIRVTPALLERLARSACSAAEESLSTRAAMSVLAEGAE